MAMMAKYRSSGTGIYNRQIAAIFDYFRFEIKSW